MTRGMWKQQNVYHVCCTALRCLTMWTRTRRTSKKLVCGRPHASSSISWWTVTDNDLPLEDKLPLFPFLIIVTLLFWPWHYSDLVLWIVSTLTCQVSSDLLPVKSDKLPRLRLRKQNRRKDSQRTHRLFTQKGYAFKCALFDSVKISTPFFLLMFLWVPACGEWRNNSTS